MHGEEVVFCPCDTNGVGHNNVGTKNKTANKILPKNTFSSITFFSAITRDASHHNHGDQTLSDGVPASYN